jgi:hypothetical protein
VVNKRAAPERYRIEVDPAEGMGALVPMATVSIPALGDARIPVFLTVPRDRFRGEFPVHLRVARDDNPARAAIVSGIFLGPSS